MQAIIDAIENAQTKKKVVAVRSGDTVRVSQRIKEGSKERVQVFEGLVIKASRTNSLTSTILVRRVASGVGVEKSFLLHSPLIEKVEVMKRSKVRRNYLTYMRTRSGKATRLAAVDFDKKTVNDVVDQEAEAQAARLKEDQKQAHEAEAATKAAEAVELDKKAAEVQARHQQNA